MRAHNPELPSTQRRFHKLVDLDLVELDRLSKKSKTKSASNKWRPKNLYLFDVSMTFIFYFFFHMS